MNRKLACITLFILILTAMLHAQQSRFEQSKGKESATYFEVIDWFRSLDKISPQVLVKEMGATDAGLPLHLVLVNSDGKFDPVMWRKAGKAVVLINNGIHPGEPDGIDASMLLVRDIVQKKIQLPENVVLAFIPVYNVGGALNRNSTSRVNQNGPLQYGFRANAQGLDLNRDFTKCDSREAKSFAQIFHWLNPDILIDNHVSDGADYQHTFTLLTTQYNKLGEGLGQWVKKSLEPALYKGMAEKKWPVCPYVNFETSTPDKGWGMFYDTPRYSSGYAALFQTIGFVPETHMLKPFADRVQATYDFMLVLMQQVALNADMLLAQRKRAKEAMLTQKIFPLSWQVDSSRYSWFSFLGYEASIKKSAVTGMDRLWYDHSKPFTKQVQLFDTYSAVHSVQKPVAYIIPQGWSAVIDLLKLNGVQLTPFKKDTLIAVEAYHIDDYKTYNKPWEKHHKNYGVKVSVMKQTVRFLKGDWIIYLNQPANRYLIEMLEPTGDDSFFSWNFFDAVLQQKEGYSDYRWEDVAEAVLKTDLSLRPQLDAKKATDTAFANNAGAQLAWVYRHSPYYEPEHLRYPVFRLVR